MVTLPIAKPKSVTSEEPPMTLQVVLRGSNGVVIASDKLVALEPHPIAFSDRYSKMVVKPNFGCTFAGDDCAKYISTNLAEKVGDSIFESSAHFMDAVREALREYKSKWQFFETQPEQ